MTKRFLYNKTWAQDGVKTDPDLDTTDPSYIANRYTNVGWKAEKPPEQWQNFLSNITDEKFADNLISLGVPVWEGHNLLKNGALSYSLDFSEIRIGVGGTRWDATVSGTSPGYISAINSLQNKYDSHSKATNPHNDTVDNIGGGTYLSKDVGSWFNSPTDNRTIIWHKLQTGAVHKETPAQVGTLPAATGGTFTGPVTFTNFSGVTLAGGGFISVTDGYKTNEEVLRFENSSAFFLDSAGNVYTRIASVNYLWATESTLPSWYIKTNYLFTAPTPMFKFNTMYSLNDGNSIGGWWMEANGSEPTTFHDKGGVSLIDTGLYWLNANSPLTRHTTKMVGRNKDGKLICRVVRHGLLVNVGGSGNGGSGHHLATLLTNLGSGDIVYLIEISVYAGDLTNQQISAIRFI